LGCSHIGDHPQEDLAKFGSKTHMKIKKFKQSFYINWLPTGKQY
jgi:hypothetical protein